MRGGGLGRSRKPRARPHAAAPLVRRPAAPQPPPAAGAAAAAALTALLCGAPRPCGCEAPSMPQGLGPQELWPTAALSLELDGAGQLNGPLAARIRSLAASAAADEGFCWRSPGARFLGDAIEAGGAVGDAARALVRRLQRAGERYFRETLRDPSLAARVEVVLGESWASLLRGPGSSRGGSALAGLQPAGGGEPHTHGGTALTGTYYVDCGTDFGGSQESRCSMWLEDPRPPASIAELPPAVRERLGFGVARRFDLTAGFAVLHPPWLLHAAGAFGSGGGIGERLAISFTANVRLRTASTQTASPMSATSDDMDDEL